MYIGDWAGNFYSLDAATGTPDWAEPFVVDDTKSGFVVKTLDHDVPLRHVWVAVDLASGNEDVDVPTATHQERGPWHGPTAGPSPPRQR